MNENMERWLTALESGPERSPRLNNDALLTSMLQVIRVVAAARYDGKGACELPADKCDHTHAPDRHIYGMDVENDDAHATLVELVDTASDWLSEHNLSA